jgi:gliding motility-associated lipoprotein GldH
MKKALLLLLVLAAFSCQKTVVVNEVQKDFGDNQWAATDVKKFEFKLKKDIEVGDIKLVFSHVHDPQYGSVPVSVTIENPAGEKENFYMNLQLKDEEGNDMSECAGDVCDLYTSVKEGVKLSKGTYKVTVENKFAYAYLANVLAVGVRVERE